MNAMYGRQTACAIAAMTRLVEVYHAGGPRLSAAEIADDRNLQRPLVAKILNVLSQAGLVQGARGPGGGFVLARPPESITIYDVYRLFERETDALTGDFVGDKPVVESNGSESAFERRLRSLGKAWKELLHETTFADLRGWSV